MLSDIDLPASVSTVGIIQAYLVRIASSGETFYGPQDLSLVFRRRSSGSPVGDGSYERIGLISMRAVSTDDAPPSTSMGVGDCCRTLPSHAQMSISNLATTPTIENLGINWSEAAKVDVLLS